MFTTESRASSTAFTTAVRRTSEAELELGQAKSIVIGPALARRTLARAIAMSAPGRERFRMGADGVGGRAVASLEAARPCCHYQEPELRCPKASATRSLKSARRLESLKTAQRGRNSLPDCTLCWKALRVSGDLDGRGQITNLVKFAGLATESAFVGAVVFMRT